MAFPTVQATATSLEDAADVTSHTVILPANISAGDLLIICFSVDGAPTITWPSGANDGFTEFFNVANGTANRFAIAYRQANGLEPATVEVATSGAERSAHVAYRITGAEDPATQAPEASTGKTGVNNAPNPLSLTPTGGAKDYLWLASHGRDRDRTIVTFPTNYLGGISTQGSGAESAGVAAAERQLNAVSEDPGSFSFSNADEWVAATVAIHPAFPMAITRTKSGLVLRDQFTRSNSNTVGGGWNEKEALAADAQILSNALAIKGASTWIWQTLGLHPADFIVQSTREAIAGDGDQLVARGSGFAGSAFATDGYRTIHRTNNNDIRLLRRVGNVDAPVLSTVAVTQVAGEFWQHRLVGAAEGLDFRVRAYLTEVASLTDLSVTPIQRINLLELAADLPPLGTQVAIVEGAALLVDKDEFFLCGRNIVMTGLPTGWKVRLDGGTAVVESGGVATLDVDAEALPGTAVQILNASDVQQDSLSPSGGVFGGDVYEAGQEVAGPGVLTVARTTKGLLTYDNNERADSDTVGAPTFPSGAAAWTEFEVSAAEMRNFNDGGGNFRLDHPNGDNKTSSISRSVPAQPATALMCGVNMQVRVATGFGFFRVRDDRPAFDFYDIELSEASNTIKLRVAIAGALDSSTSAAVTVTSPNVQQVRMILEESGADTLLRAYMGQAGGFLDGLKIKHGDLTLFVSHSDVGRQLAGVAYGVDQHDRHASYQYFLCGRNIVVNGLPAGHKIQVDSRAPIVESGGSVTLDVDAMEFPAITINILDPTDSIVAFITPTDTPGREGGSDIGSVWGGDVYTVTETVSLAFLGAHSRRGRQQIPVQGGVF